MTFYFAMLMFLTDGVSIYDLPDWFTATIAPLGIPFPVVVAAVVLIVTAFLLNRLSIGRQIYGLGATSRERNAWAATFWAFNASSTATRV